MSAELQALASRLLGSWATSSTHVAMPGTVITGTSRFEWLAGERFLLHWSAADHPDFPDALSVIGGGQLDWFDSRGVRRVFSLSLTESSLVAERPKSEDDFGQRMTLTVEGEEVRLLAERADDGVTWQPDLEATFRRTG